MKKFFILSVILVFSLSACGIAGMMNTDPKPTSDQLLSANYGPEPADHIGQIKTYWNNALVNPVGAIVEVGPLHKAWSYQPKNPVETFNVSGSRVVYGYGACGFLNAQNRMGGYAGRQIFWAFFHDGRLLAVMDIPTKAWEICNTDLTAK